MTTVLDLRAHAQDRMNRIRQNLSAAADEYLQALEDEDWKTLGFPDVETWRAELMAGVKFSKAARQAIVKTLTVQGKTQRQIAAATGAGMGTVERDQKEVGAPSGAQASPRQLAARDREAAKDRQALPKTNFQQPRQQSAPGPRPAVQPPADLPPAPADPKLTEHAEFDARVRPWRDQGLSREQIATTLGSTRARVWDALSRLEGEDRALRSCTCGNASRV